MIILWSQATYTAALSQFVEAFRPGTQEEMRQYVNLYKRTLNADWLEELSPQEQERKQVASFGRLIRLHRTIGSAHRRSRRSCVMRTSPSGEVTHHAIDRPILG